MSHLLTLILALISLIFLTSCEFIKSWQIDHPDNKIEQNCENVIESLTGFSVDLSPLTGTETIFDKLKDEKESKSSN